MSRHCRAIVIVLGDNVRAVGGEHGQIGIRLLSIFIIPVVRVDVREDKITNVDRARLDLEEVQVGVRDNTPVGGLTEPQRIGHVGGFVGPHCEFQRPINQRPNVVLRIIPHMQRPLSAHRTVGKSRQTPLGLIDSGERSSRCRRNGAGVSDRDGCRVGKHGVGEIVTVATDIGE